MGKDFLKLKLDHKQMIIVLFAGGILLIVFLGVGSYRSAMLVNDCEVVRNEAGKGDYEQDVIAKIDGEENVALTLTIKERQFTEKEARTELRNAREVLDAYFAEMDFSENENIYFPEQVQGTCVEAEWIVMGEDYFYADGTRREDVEITEPADIEIKAILSCQNYTEDYRNVICIRPVAKTAEKRMLELIEKAQEQTAEEQILVLPKAYDGKEVTWKKPMDFTFVYLIILMLCGTALLKIGQEYDKKAERRERMEQLERDYPQIISKFAMLLSAGLSIRNAWERIVRIYQKKGGEGGIVYEEMSRSLCEMEKGISELEVYINFGNRVGQIHYKKLMGLFVSYKKRGNMQLLETMNQEMLQAWEERKYKIRQQGEKIGTKLLIPMMGMLGVVFCMILVPAFLSFQI